MSCEVAPVVRRWCSFCFALLGQALFCGTVVFGQTEVQPDQYEPNNTQEQAKQLVLSTGPTASGASSVTIQANFHDATDTSDWFRFDLTMQEFGQFPFCNWHYQVRFEAVLSAMAPDNFYDLRLSGGGNWSPSLPIEVRGNQGASLSVNRQTSACGDVARVYVEVHRGGASTVSENYTLSVRLSRSNDPPVITAILPLSGPVGTVVTISGSNLLPGVVRFNGVTASPPTGSPNSVTTTVPVGATTGPVVLESVNGTQAVGSQVFTVTSGPTPSGSGSASTPKSCCSIFPNATLKGRLGRLVIAFPTNAVPTGTRIAVFKGGNEVQADYGNHIFELLSGVYEVTIAGKRIQNVTVKVGHDTNVKVGVLRITGPTNRRVSVREAGQEIAGAYGGELIGLPIGTYAVQIGGQTERVTVTEGKVTDF